MPSSAFSSLVASTTGVTTTEAASMVSTTTQSRRTIEVLGWELGVGGALVVLGVYLGAL